MRIAIFNCKYSENLGDGLIAETLEAVLRHLQPGQEVVSCDLAGRCRYGHLTMPNRSRALAALSWLPPPARRQAVAIVLGRRRASLREAWRERLEGARLAVFGGGQLFQDGDLNFPLKLGTAFELCAALGVPVAVHAVGVSRNWSRRGTALFNRLLATDTVGVSVRDRASQAAWAQHFRGTRLERADVVPDPVLAAPVSPPERSTAIGLNVTHPILLGYHSGRRAKAGAIAETMRGCVRLLLERGHEVVLFTNGASEDEAFLDRIVASLPTARLRRAPRPLTPAGLVAEQRRLRAVIAHRLHASVLAYRLGLPSVGLGWDHKVESFYAGTGREQFFLPDRDFAPERVVAVLEQALAAGVDPDGRARLSAAAYGGIARLLLPREASALAR